MSSMPRLLVPPVVLGLLAVASAAGASPSISVVSPTPGPLSTDQPTLTVVYSSDDPGAPLDLVSLRILVNGSDWTGKFVQSAGSATYDVSAQDAFAAGRITIEASISDVVGGLASASQPYDLVPTIRAIAPTVARPGDELTLEVVGLDPSAANNIAVFPSAFVRWPQGAEVVFSTVDRETKRGTVVVPAGAITGSLSVRVNDVASAGSPNLTILGDFDVCGYYVRKMISLASGRMAVLSVGGCALAGFDAQGAVTLQDPGEPMVLVTAAPWNGSVYIVTIAADKTGNGPAVISGRVLSDSPLILETIVKYKGTESRVAMAPVNGGADFDSEGNLYLTASIGASGAPAGPYLVRLSAEDLARGGTIGYTTVAQLPVSDPVRYLGTYYRGLSVSCEGRAYIGIGTWARAGMSWEGEVREIDLATGAVTNTMALNGLVAGDFPLFDLALTGNPGELLGTSLVAEDWLISDVEVWRGVMGQQAPTRLAFLPNNSNPTHLTVAPNGDVYASLNDDLLSLGYKVQVVDPCPGAACPPPRPQPYCNATPVLAEIEILPTTTRWRPQRSPLADPTNNDAPNTPIKIDFSGPGDIDVSTPGTLEIQGPAGTITVTGSITKDPEAGVPYRMLWSAPFTYTDAGGQTKPLPPANYTVKVKATVGTAPDQQVIESQPYNRLSLVEVTGIEVTACNASLCPDPTAFATLMTNPTGMGGEMGIVPDASDPGLGYRQDVAVRAIVAPDLGSDLGLVTVHFKLLDVDDPSPSYDGTAVDDDSAATSSVDNVNEAAVLPPSAVPAKDAAGQVVAKVVFKSSTQQGNNYRIAASTSLEWVGTLCGVVSSTAGEVRRSPCTPPMGGTILSSTPENNEAAQVTALLTVWRTLRLEQDALDSGVLAQTALDPGTVVLDVTGVVTGLQPQRLEDAYADFTDTDHPSNDHWAWAQLWPNVTGSAADPVVRVERNGNTDLRVDPATNLAQLTQLTAAYRLRDDIAVQLGSLPLTLLEQRLGRAYIRMEAVPSTRNATAEHPFIRNHTDSDLAFTPRNVQSSPEYWSVLLLDAFDADRRVDNDPGRPGLPDGHARNEPGRLGTTVGQVTNPPPPPVSPLTAQDLFSPIAGVYRETTRDTTEEKAPGASADAQIEQVTAHEVICHAMNLGHIPGNLCNDGPVYTAAGQTLGGQYVAELRRQVRPRVCASRPGGAPCPLN